MYLIYHRHGHKFEQNLIRNGKGVLFPPQTEILECDEFITYDLTHGWKWYVYSGDYGKKAIFKNIQVLDLYDNFREKSLHTSHYEVDITIKVYFDWQGRSVDGSTDNFYTELELITNDSGRYPKQYFWESLEQKWKKVVLAAKVSLKNVRYLKFVQEMMFENLGFPFGTYLPRAQMRVSFPMYRDKDQVIPEHE